MSTVISRQDALTAFKSNLARWISEQGITQGQFARMLFGDEIAQTHRNKISRWCNGSVEPGPADLANIAEVMGCSIDDLLSYKPPRKKTSGK